MYPGRAAGPWQLQTVRVDVVSVVFVFTCRTVWNSTDLLESLRGWTVVIVRQRALTPLCCHCSPTPSRRMIERAPSIVSYRPSRALALSSEWRSLVWMESFTHTEWGNTCASRVLRHGLIGFSERDVTIRLCSIPGAAPQLQRHRNCFEVGGGGGKGLPGSKVTPTQN